MAVGLILKTGNQENETGFESGLPSGTQSCGSQMSTVLQE